MPTENGVIEARPADLTRPAITLWEHRAARRALREAGRQSVDEELIFRTIEASRDLVDSAARQTKEIRCHQARRAHLDAGARQVDDVAPDMELPRLWAMACRMDPERLRRKSLASRNPDRPQDWFLTETVPACLACFDADVAAGRDAYLRVNWRLAEQVVCQSHRTMLLDRCPACRGGLRPTFRMLNGLLRPFCRKCDAVLTGGGGGAGGLRHH